jgi:hypothetical protein
MYTYGDDLTLIYGKLAEMETGASYRLNRQI